jgi:CheY-like chemotaxis protein
MAHLLEVSVSKRAVLKYRFAPDLPAIEGDATQLRQVIMNLITNASDAIGDRSGVISIATGLMYADAAYLRTAYMDDGLPEGDYVYLEVADTGIGMDPETAARIFDPFFTTKFTGRGLGLAAVLGIVRGHRGAIKLYTEPGRGTTFKILFPAAGSEPAGAPVGIAEASPPSAAPAVILVVDDDETVRSVTRRMLEQAGHTVLVAADGHQALDVYRQRPGIDLVLLDMTMPRMDGEETFRELRRVDPGVRVILTSGYNEQDATERFAGKGLAGFIQKPYRPQDLLEKVRAALQPKP